MSIGISFDHYMTVYMTVEISNFKPVSLGIMSRVTFVERPPSQE